MHWLVNVMLYYEADYCGYLYSGDVDNAIGPLAVVGYDLSLLFIITGSPAGRA